MSARHCTHLTDRKTAHVAPPISMEPFSAAIPGSSEPLSDHCRPPRNSGLCRRSLESVLPLLADPTLPQPDFTSSPDVGASLVHGDTLQPIQPLQSAVDALWPGDSRSPAPHRTPLALERQDVPQVRRYPTSAALKAASNPELLKIAESLGCDLLYSPSVIWTSCPKASARAAAASADRLVGTGP